MDETAKETAIPIYIGRLPCSCVVAMCVDDPKWKKDTARDISRWIKDGYTVERTTDRTLLCGEFCKLRDYCTRPKQKAKQLAEQKPK